MEARLAVILTMIELPDDLAMVGQCHRIVSLRPRQLQVLRTHRLAHKSKSQRRRAKLVVRLTRRPHVNRLWSDNTFLHRTSN